MAIVPTISTSKDSNNQIAHLQWRGTIDNGIAKAIDQGLAHHGVMGLYATEYGEIAWSLFAIESEKIFKSNPDDLYWFNLILKPDPFYTKWLELLKNQSELRMLIDLQGKSIFVPLLEKDALEKYIEIQEKSFSDWSISANPRELENKTAEVQNWIYNKVVPQRIEIIKESTRTGESSDTLLKLVSERAIVELTKESMLRSLAGKNLSMERYLTEWSSYFEAAENLSETHPNSKSENICRDWFYTNMCLEKSTPGRYKIPWKNTNGWTWKPTTISTLRLLWSASKNLRLLLDRDWQQIIDIKDVPSPPLESIYLSDFGHLKTSIDQTSDIIKSAIINRVYGLNRAVIHVGMIGCRSIHFESIDKNLSQVLVKFVVGELKYNSCLFGVISPQIGEIRWISPAEINSEAIKIINFLVAITFRDLLICREGFDGQTTQPSQGKKEKRKPKAQSQISKIQLVARIKKGSSISESTSDTDAMIHKLSKFFRVGHLRRLPEGHKASTEQIQLAQEYGYLLPVGHTFVRPTGEQSDPNVYRSISLINLFLK
jgi:hypothetical protein